MKGPKQNPDHWQPGVDPRLRFREPLVPSKRVRVRKIPVGKSGRVLKDPTTTRGRFIDQETWEGLPLLAKLKHKNASTTHKILYAQMNGAKRASETNRVIPLGTNAPSKQHETFMVEDTVLYNDIPAIVTAVNGRAARLRGKNIPPNVWVSFDALKTP